MFFFFCVKELITLLWIVQFIAICIMSNRKLKLSLGNHKKKQPLKKNTPKAGIDA